MDSKKMDIVMDVKVSVTVQLGTAELPMKEVVELSPGAQIQLKPVSYTHLTLPTT